MIFAQTPLISPITQDQADVIQEEVRRLMDTVCMRVYAVATLPIAKLREVTHTNFGKPTRRHVCEIFDIPRAQAENQEDPLTHLVTEKVKSLDMFRWINVKWYG